MLMFSIFLLVAAVLPFTVGGKLGHIQRGRHQELAQRARGDVGIHKRSFDNARFTFYDVGLGACGQYSSPSDFMVAINVIQFGPGYPGPLCFKSITISYGGKTAQATIMDKCMGCPNAGLDFSKGLFDYFASEDEGVLYGTWWFNDDISELPTPPVSPEWTPAPIPALSTPTPTPTPTFTYVSYQHHQVADTTSTLETSTTSETIASTPSPTETSTTSETPTSTPSTTETSTTSETPTSTPSTSETSPTATATYSSISLTYGTDIPIPTGVVAVPIAVPAPNAGNPQNLEVLGEALVGIGMLVSGQRGN
ncbi:hypothetical protein BDR06DRAFT_947437 [Suillus hirtellus]|nr:hypothetical protein BDR06DRAFT_947437 [Suillus hirtellus]